MPSLTSFCVALTIISSTRSDQRDIVAIKDRECLKPDANEPICMGIHRFSCAKSALYVLSNILLVQGRAPLHLAIAHEASAIHDEIRIAISHAVGGDFFKYLPYTAGANLI